MTLYSVHELKFFKIFSIRNANLNKIYPFIIK